MVEEQLRRNGVADERVLWAMDLVPREEFVSREMREYAYVDRALGIAAGQTISQPLVVAAMTAAAAPAPDDVALDVGTGSGYQAAILSLLCKRVVSIEREETLAEHAAATLARLGFNNVEVVLGDGASGYEPAAPYPVIVVAAAARRVPKPLLEQLADGGRLLIPLETPGDENQELRVIRRRGREVTSELIFPVRFVPLITG